jgi:hypothetical protein
VQGAGVGKWAVVGIVETTSRWRIGCGEGMFVVIVGQCCLKAGVVEVVEAAAYRRVV